MKHYHSKIHHRQSLRLAGYDYAKEGSYFITLCCAKRSPLFGEITQEGQMVLNTFGQIAHDEWVNTLNIRNNIELDAFVIMPNHIHAIIHIRRRGESHSPYGRGELIRQTVGANRIRQRYEKGESNSPNSSGESNSPSNNRIRKGRMNSPNSSGESNSPLTEKGECNSPQRFEKGECNSPQHSPRRFVSPSHTVGAIVRGYKSAVTKQLNQLHIGCEVWQRNYFEHIIRNDMAYQRISAYIKNNPAKWAQDKFFTP
jgi:putative transposase